MSRPKGEGDDTKQLAVWLNEEIDRKLAQRAVADGKSKRAVVTAALSAYLGSAGRDRDDADDDS